MTLKLVCNECVQNYRKSLSKETVNSYSYIWLNTIKFSKELIEENLQLFSVQESAMTHKANFPTSLKILDTIHCMQ